MIVGLSGYARAGKDTVAGFLVEDFHFVQGSVTDIFKEMLEELNPIVETGPSAPRRWREVVDYWGFEEAKDQFPEIRGLMQRLGFEVRERSFEPDFWVNQLIYRHRNDEKFVFSSVRDPIEAQAIKAQGGVIWRIDRPGYGPANTHASETAMDGWLFDDLLINDGTLEQLREMATDAYRAAND